MLKEDAETLREEWIKVTRAQYEAQALLHDFNARVMRTSARHVVPPGHAIDYLGDGTIKPTGECATSLAK